MRIFRTVLLGLALLSFSAPVKAEDGVCNDRYIYNGYMDRKHCVPGMITNETWFTPQPVHTVGKATWYAPGLMRATAEYRGMELEGFVDGVSLYSPADIGKVVWIKRSGFVWEGPFLVVDCSQRNHMFTTVTYIGEVVEVSFETARRWGMVTGSYEDYREIDWMIRNVELFIGELPPADAEPISYAEWFLDMVEFDSRFVRNRRLMYSDVRYFSYAEYWDSLQWKYFSEHLRRELMR